MSLKAGAASLTVMAIVAPTLGTLLHNGCAGIVPGLVAAAWTGWPLYQLDAFKRHNFLNPAPRRYSKNVQETFKAIRKELRERSYLFGDKWHVATAEVSELRIFADLKYVDEFKDYDFSHQTMSIKQNVDRKKRYLSLEAWLKSEGKSTVVQYEFKTRIEGLDQGACDDIISGLLNALENVLGPSEPTSEVIHKPIPTPPWPLLVATAIGSTKPDHFNIWSPHERTPDIQQRHINKSNDHLNAYLAFSILAVE